MGRKRSLIHGIGINDSETRIGWKDENGNQIRCPVYTRWKDMLQRCYSPKRQEKYPTYIGCSVCEEWLTFSNFKAWLTAHPNWGILQLDKDILDPENKIYSPETCVMVPREVNVFIIDRGAKRGELPIGVSLDKRANKYQTRCGNPFTGKAEYLGLFTCSEAAHLTWKAKKLEHTYSLRDAGYITDDRVFEAIKNRYL